MVSLGGCYGSPTTVISRGFAWEFALVLFSASRFSSCPFSFGAVEPGDRRDVGSRPLFPFLGPDQTQCDRKTFTIAGILLLTTLVAFFLTLLRFRQEIALKRIAIDLCPLAARSPHLELGDLSPRDVGNSWRAVSGPRASRQNALNRRPRWLAAIGLFAGWGVSWRVAIELMLSEYYKLPTTQPQCYIATAATFGHRWLVKTESVPVCPDGVIQINPQLRRLKFLEILLQCGLPRFIGGFARVTISGPAAGCDLSPLETIR